ncbi:MAG: ABC transporter ATP-binding protein [Bacilli bacterium]|nr:ABC transporter ATP-binding protein [Bacilli bacterium]
MNNNSRPKIKFDTIKRLLSYLGNYKKRLILVFICILISSVTGVLGALFLKSLVDDYISPMLINNSTDYTPLLKALIMISGIYIFGVIANYIYNISMSKVSQGILRDVRDEMFSKMETLPISYFDRNKHGDIMSRYTNDTDSLRQMISQSIPNLVSSLMTIIAVIVSMFTLNVYLTLFVLVFTVITIFITRYFAMNSAKFFVKERASLGKVNAYIEEMLNGQKVVKVFNHEEIAINEFDKLNEELNKVSFNGDKNATIVMPIAGNLGYLEYALVALIGTYLVINGYSIITVGTIISFLNLTRSFQQPVNQVTNQLNSIIMALAGASRIFDLMDTKPEIDDGYVTLTKVIEKDGKYIEDENGFYAWRHPHHDGTLSFVPLKGHIELLDVDFSYEENKQVLYDINIYAKPGQKIALVGATGAGKTTITNLLNRFYELEDGKVRYDGININKIKKKDLRNSLGMVLQDIYLFTGTIKENIKYGKPNATDEEVIKACKLANAHDFIMRLPKGYDTELTGNGQELSQGQRQLLSIARVAISDPPVMILDEATSSIDTRTEKIVNDGMDKLMEGRTVFVIAHRLSTIRNSKAIMVMSNGHIIERGNHEELLKLKGEYYKLYTGLFELE